jgi:hypothetical protein
VIVRAEARLRALKRDIKTLEALESLEPGETDAEALPEQRCLETRIDAEILLIEKLQDSLLWPVP